jgi:nucleoside 2-deoxyribosyltransferase
MKFYTAGKIWHADKFRHLRDTIGLPVQARWIDLKQDDPIVVSNKRLLWQMCYEDVRDSDFVLLYSEDMAEEQRGALVEIGMAYGMGKPVYAVGKCGSICPNGISDVAFTHHHLWTWLDTDNLVKGAFYSIASQLGRNRNVETLKKVA